MTAFGRGICQSDVGSIVVEIQSVNRKFLEIHLNIPKELRRFEMDIRKWLGEDILCGQVYINISAKFQQMNPVRVTPNLTLVKELHQAWLAIAQELKLDFDAQFKLSLLAHESAVLTYEADIEHDEQYKDMISKAVQNALENFNRMRLHEGSVLQKDLQERTKHLNSAIEKVSSKVEDAPKKFREKLAKKLEEVLPGCVENEERLLRELVVYCEKVDVSEEITRFNSHLKQLNMLFDGQTKGVGKALDFVTQELNREANTLGSKSPDLEISHLVVEIKTELAKIREQIQNIE